MSDGWKYWDGKRVYIILKNNRRYTGKVIEIDTTSAVPLVWITITDKFDKRVTFVHSEIETIQEERE